MRLMSRDNAIITRLKMIDRVPTDHGRAKDSTVGREITGPVPRFARMEMAIPNAMMNMPRVKIPARLSASTTFLELICAGNRSLSKLTICIFDDHSPDIRIGM